MLSNAIKRFLEFRRPNTRRTYSRALRDLITHLGKRDIDDAEADLRRLSAEQAMAFMATLKRTTVKDGSDIADNTLRLKFSALRSVYQHLTDIEILPRNPWNVAVKLLSNRQKTQKRPTKLVPYTVVAQLLELPNIRMHAGVRDRALLALLFGCGLRRSELVALNVGDVMVSSRGTLYLEIRRAKGGKARQQPIPKWAGEAFSALVSQRKSDGAAASDALFPFYYRSGKCRGRLSVETLYRTFRFYVGLLGVKASPHSARATAATKLLEQGYNDRDVALFLGHSTPLMVQTYDKRRREVDENPGKRLVFH